MYRYDDDFLKHLRQKNLERVGEFGHGGIHGGWNVAEWGCAVAGECGELCNILKKINRQAPTDPTPDELVIAAGEEIADTLIYLDLIAAKLDLDLAHIVRLKFNKTSEKMGYPQRV